jgi:hypothetical protein
MGFFDSLMKDIANGDLDKKLLKVADTVEKFSGKMEGTVKTLADQPEKLSKTVDTASRKAVDTVKSIDGINK